MTFENPKTSGTDTWRYSDRESVSYNGEFRTGDAYLPIYFDEYNENLETSGDQTKSTVAINPTSSDNNTDDRLRREFDYEGFSDAYLYDNSNYVRGSETGDPYYDTTRGIYFEGINSLANKKFGPVIMAYYKSHLGSENLIGSAQDWTEQLSISEVNELTSRFVQPVVQTVHYDGKAGFETSSTVAVSTSIIADPTAATTSDRIVDYTLDADKHYDGLYFLAEANPGDKVVHSAFVRQLTNSEAATGDFQKGSSNTKTIQNHSQDVIWGFDQEKQYAVIKEVITAPSGGFNKGDPVLKVFKNNSDGTSQEILITAPFDRAYFFREDSSDNIYKYGDKIGTFAESLATVDGAQIPAYHKGKFVYTASSGDTVKVGQAVGYYEELSFQRGDKLLSTQNTPENTTTPNPVINQYAEYSATAKLTEGSNLKRIVDALVDTYTDSGFLSAASSGFTGEDPLQMFYDYDATNNNMMNDAIEAELATLPTIEDLSLGSVHVAGQILITSDVSDAYIPLSTHISGAAETHSIAPGQHLNANIDGGTYTPSDTSDVYISDIENAYHGTSKEERLHNTSGWQGSDVVSIYTPIEKPFKLELHEGVTDSNIKTLSPNFITWDDDVKGHADRLQIEIQEGPRFGELKYEDPVSGNTVNLSRGDVVSLEDIYNGRIQYKVDNTANVGSIVQKTIPLNVPQFETEDYKVVYRKDPTDPNDIIFSMFELDENGVPRGNHAYEQALQANGLDAPTLYPSSQAGIAYKGEILAVIQNRAGATFEIRASETGRFTPISGLSEGGDFRSFGSDGLGTLEVVQTVLDGTASSDRHEWQDGFKFNILEAAHGDFAFANQYWQINLFDLIPKGADETADAGLILEDRETEKVFNVLANDYDPDTSWDDLSLKIENLAPPSFSQEDIPEKDIHIEEVATGDLPITVDSRITGGETLVKTGDTLATISSTDDGASLLGFSQNFAEHHDFSGGDLGVGSDGSSNDYTGQIITIDQLNNQITLPSTEDIVADSALYTIKKHTNIYAPDSYNHPTETGSVIFDPKYELVSSIVDISASANSATIYLSSSEPSAGAQGSREPDSYDSFEIDRIFSNLYTPELNLFSEEYENAKFELQAVRSTIGAASQGEIIFKAKIVNADTEDDIFLDIKAPYEGDFSFM
ncbi:MAG: hypothetical protein GWP59_08330, partial [Chlamydiales bacterium]|nr:hypothetical protein [Chlamydiales bacterium]